jgi:hypothetical protein
MTIAPHDFDAMQRAIDVMRHESPDRAKQIEHKLKHEGFKAAGHFAAYAVQCASLRLKLWEAPTVLGATTVFWSSGFPFTSPIRRRRLRKPKPSPSPLAGLSLPA